MAKKPKDMDSHPIESSFVDLTMTRDQVTFREFIGSEKLTGRRVRILLVSEAVVERKTTADFQEYLKKTGLVASLPNSAALLRAELLPGKGLLLVFESGTESLVEHFSNESHRDFNKISTTFITLSALLHRIQGLDLIHGELSCDVIDIEAGGQPLVRGIEFIRFASIDGQVLRQPSDSTPPELLTDGEIGAATDAYGLGSVLYYCLTGHRWTDSYPDLVDAILTKSPGRRPAVGDVDRIYEIAISLLDKKAERRPSAFVKIAAEVNKLRSESGLPLVLTGVEAIDSTSASSKSSLEEWSQGVDIDLTLPGVNKTTDVETAEDAPIRDADDRSLSARAVTSGRQPKVITVHRGMTSISEERNRSSREVMSHLRNRAELEEWRPEIGSDAWTIPADDFAPISICRNGHRVSFGSMFCNFCGVSLAPAVISDPGYPSLLCPNGHRAAPDAKFCRICGTQIATDAQVVVDDGGISATKELVTFEPEVTPAPIPKTPASFIAASPPTGESAPKELDISAARDNSGIATAPPDDTRPDSTSDDYRFEEIDTALCASGHPNLASAKFCRQCDARMISNVAPIDAARTSETDGFDVIFCVNDHPNRSFARFCRWCAKPLSTPRPAAREISEPIATEVSEPTGLPGRPFVLTAKDDSADDHISIIFNQDQVAPALEEDNIIRVLGNRGKEVRAVRRTVIDGEKYSPITLERAAPPSEPEEK